MLIDWLLAVTVAVFLDILLRVVRTLWVWLVG
jgi:hypothetical protein